MSKFEVKEVYISDLILDPNKGCPKRTLNIQVDLNYEGNPNPTPEEVAKELGDTIAQDFLNTPQAWSCDAINMEKKEILIQPKSGCFGWYNLKEKNLKGDLWRRGPNMISSQEKTGGIK